MITAFKICLIIVACLFYILAMGTKTEERMFICYTAAGIAVSLIMIITSRLL